MRIYLHGLQRWVSTGEGQHHEKGGGGHGARQTPTTRCGEGGGEVEVEEVSEVVVVLGLQGIDLRGSNEGESINNDGRDTRSSGAMDMGQE